MNKFPIGFWNYVSLENQDASAVKEWKEAGMTLAMSPNFNSRVHSKNKMIEILDEAQRQGITVILCDDRALWEGVDSDEAGYRRRFQEALDDFGSHPAVLGFSIGDEPGGRDHKDFMRACKAYIIQKEMAPHLSPFCNLLSWSIGMEPYINNLPWSKVLDIYCEQSDTDFLCYDCYFQMNPGHEGWDAYFRNLREYSEASKRYGIPFWTTLLSVGHFRYRCPKEDDFRWQLNTAIAHGAKGILWFFFYMGDAADNYRVAPIDEHWERTETFEWLSRVNRTFLKGHAEIIKDLELVKVYHQGEAWGGVELFAPDNLVSEFKSFYNIPLILSEFKDIDGHNYIMVVNNSQVESNKFEIEITGSKPELFKFDRHGSANKVKPEINIFTNYESTNQDIVRFEQYLAPGQGELFRVDFN